MPEEKTLRLILGDQLNVRHSWFDPVRKNMAYTMMEVRQETDYVTHHIQKVTGFFAAMRQFAQEITGHGHRLFYLGLDHPENEQDIEQNLKKLIKREKFTRVEYLLPDEYRLDRQLEHMASRLPVPVAAAETEHFLTDRKEVKSFFKAKKRYLMESFYRQMRKKYDILLENGKPMGGKWNYDQRNRNRYDEAVPVPKAKVFNNDVSGIVDMIDQCGIKTFGNIEPKSFIWPVSRAQSLELLREFLENRFPFFGTYQDAMTTESWSLFHSRLSFSLNTKMLHPMEVIRSAMAQAQSANDPEISIEQLEGFVRQILGWREYVRGIYWAQMPAYEILNYFGHKGSLPDYYWTGKTRMNCMGSAIKQSLDHAYAHHIQRLMITGNFALLAGVHPDEVDAWYLGVYMDAIQWVELINTRGMSQFADGGIVATKPYIASANYIRKMSDYCNGCVYIKDKSHGDGSCPFNSLYWSFLHQHRQKLEKNPRMSMMYRTMDRMTDSTRNEILHQARKYRAGINSL
jgi:deoxyribodipyrimidine photolyase-related protein